MGSVYPILEKEEPPEGKPETGGQEEEEKGQEHEEHDEWKQWRGSWRESWKDSWKEEEKYLEEACQEVQRDTRPARTRPRTLTEAKEEFERDQAAGRKALQAAQEKFKTRRKGKKGILAPEMPHKTPCTVRYGTIQETHPTSPQPSTYDGQSRFAASQPEKAGRSGGGA